MEQQLLRGTRICHSLHPAITIITTVTPIITIDALKCGSTTKNAIIMPKGIRFFIHPFVKLPNSSLFLDKNPA